MIIKLYSILPIKTNNECECVKRQLSSTTLQTPASGYPGVMDDLIFSGAGPGCRGDDEDECTPPFEAGSGDDLITPVYVPPTKQPQQSNNRNNNKNNKGTDSTTGEKTCDDEDCLHGSGAGEITDTSKNTGG